MRTLRLFLAALLAIAIALAIAFGVAVNQLLTIEGMANVSGAFAAGLALFAFLVIPQAAVYVWSSKYAGAVESITDGVRKVLAGDHRRGIAWPAAEGEVSELGHMVEDMRRVLVGQIELFNTQKAVLNEIVDGLGEGLLAIDRARRIVLANRRTLELFAVPSEVLGRNFVEVIRNASLVAAFEQSLAGRPSSGRTTIGTDKSARRIEIRTFPMTTSLEIAAVALFIDITAIERLETIRREFLDDFAHEVKTPLAGLHSAVESFSGGGLTAEQEEKLRGIIVRQIRRLDRLVLDISELNRIETGEVELQREPIDVYALLADVVEDFRDQAANANVELRLEGEPSSAIADPLKLEQICSNLIDNALKHSGKSVRVDVSVAGDGPDCVIRVRDYGEGIPASEQDRIFHRFYRVDRSRSQEVAGSGLGLAITKHLVLLQGGSIRVESEPGEGAMFEVRLPGVPGA